MPHRLVASVPFDWPGLLDFVAPRAFAGVERIADGRYLRSFAFDGAHGFVRVGCDAGNGRLTVDVRTASPGAKTQAVARVRRLFDLDTDAAAVSRHLAKDRVLAPLVRRHRGLRVPGAWDPFEIAVRAILGQQVSVKAATTLATRVVTAYGEPLDPALAGPSGLVRLFPRPEVLAGADLVKLGVIGARARCIAGFAATCAADPDLFTRSRTLDELVTTLVRLPGIGPWTAQYVGMRAMGERDAFPHGDLGLVKAWSALCGRPVTARELAVAAERWRPYRAYAAMLLWRSLAAPSGG
jgi:AraC family transcriptional regulator of adaptative response / DNA-3-methyladenine glycosylase II